jgi:hypothetical protein
MVKRIQLVAAFGLHYPAILGVAFIRSWGMPASWRWHVDDRFSVAMNDPPKTSAIGLSRLISEKKVGGTFWNDARLISEKKVGGTNGTASWYKRT